MIEELPEDFDLFTPLSDSEKTMIHKENEADIKAAQKMATLFDAIKKDNPGLNDNELHSLNVFFSRILFCFFSESTEIFEKGLFSDTIASHTSENGSNLNKFLSELFESLDVKNKSSYPKYIQKFPYVNGRLFAEKFPIPKFSRNSRKILLECGDLNWSSINPDIFGSMIQAVVSESQRSSMGMHYTSVANIMKVIEPLFLDELKEEFKKSSNMPKRLERLLHRLSSIRIFDPACGSGNFLIIAYKELRRFEIQLLKHLELLGKHPTFLSQVQLSQFYGIEIDEFACEIAKLSLWLTEHQMNMIFKMSFGGSTPSLPLKDGGHIVCGNATRLDWEEICPKESDTEVYILGNPPYLGARHQNKEQKHDMLSAMGNLNGRNNIDYISCWVFKGSDYIRNINAQCAFVSTNSIFQGSQVSLIWPYALQNSLEIGFAYNSFKWSNHAKKNAAVICVIFCLRNISNKTKYIYSESEKRVCKNINCYLVDSANVFVENRRSPLSNLPQMSLGSMPNDGGHLILSADDYSELLMVNQKYKKFIKEVVGAKEHINGIKRYCLWISDNNLDKALSIIKIKDKIEKVKRYRAKSKRQATRALSKFPHRFEGVRHIEGLSIVVPRVSSEKREYIPFGYTKHVILDSAQAIYNAEPYFFGVISSRMHMSWVRLVAGRLKTDYRYSSALCYNSFPVPELHQKQKDEISNRVREVFFEREKHPQNTLAELYDPKKMPDGLRKAHQNLDAAVECCYRSKPFESDEERLEHLFKLYEEMIQNENKNINN